MWSRLTYTFRETGASLRRNVTLTVAAILTSAVSLFLVGGTFLVQRGFDNLLSKWAGGVQMIVYVNAKATPEQITAVQEALSSNSTVIDISKLQYFDTDQSLAEAKRLFAADPGAYALLTKDNIPTEFKVVPTAGKLGVLVQLASTFRTIPQVQKVVLAQDQIEQIAKLRDFVQTVTVGLSILLLIGALILIWTTIRTAMFARRREIEVMKLVGATNWFIRIPFMLEGLVQGLVGGLLSCGFLLFFNRLWTNGVVKLKGDNGFIALVVSDSFLNSVMFGVVVFGMVAGAIASGVAASRFLDV
ncbi:MAG: ftsX [Ilumatobacteraceae bacterium]|nr:ftsX [Ilumatobacteraceae bacterium]MCU1390348.1 ftsX [Ilumatobacteraceae bacterium]